MHCAQSVRELEAHNADNRHSPASGPSRCKGDARERVSAIRASIGRIRPNVRIRTSSVSCMESRRRPRRGGRTRGRVRDSSLHEYSIALQLDSNFLPFLLNLRRRWISDSSLRARGRVTEKVVASRRICRLPRDGHRYSISRSTFYLTWLVGDSFIEMYHVRFNADSSPYPFIKV